MKLSPLIFSAILLSACNFTLAQDVTPPPDYVPPTPVATLGPLFPAQAPSTENGALIFTEKCAPCHGATGMGDGEQGIQLNVPVTALGLPEVARPASPAQWYTVVTQGRMERFMPPFASLSDQERWDVVAYAMTLHTLEEEIAQGKELFETNCAGCSTEFFTNQEQMSTLSGVELARIVRQGNEQVPAFGAALSDEEAWAVSAYLRTLSFDIAPMVSALASSATPEAGPVTQPPASEETSSAAMPAGTPLATGEATAIAEAGPGTVSGSIENRTNIDLPSDLRVTLRGYDHGADPNTGPQEVFSQATTVDAKGSFVFENIEMPLNRIFVAEITFDGVDLQSGFAIVNEGATRLILPPIILYNKTEDTSALVIDEAQVIFEYGTDVVQVFNVYSFRNPSEEIILVKFNERGEIPFIKPPEGASGFGYEPTQGSEPFQEVENGFAIPPSEGSYGLIAFASLPKAKQIQFSQEFSLPLATLTVFAPEGVTVQNERLTNLGLQTIENFNYQIYEMSNVTSGETLNLAVSGTPREAGTTSTSNQNLLIGAGALGIALILVGAWMYWRNRGGDATREQEETNEFESSEEVIDAIIALDDLHRAQKISEAAYQKRRTELKEVLKKVM